MTVYVNNLTINMGAYFSKDFYITSSDYFGSLVGFAVSSYIRKHPDSLNPTAKFNTSILDPQKGLIRVSLASSITAEIKPGRYVYDVLLISPTKKSIIIEGNIIVRENITNN